MKRIACIFLSVLIIAAGCTKDSGSNAVEIYMLQSFTAGVDSSHYPATTVIRNPVLESTPLVANSEIKSYSATDRVFTLGTNIQDRVKNFTATKAFAVTVNKEIIYCGTVHPGYLSSMRLGIATFDPIGVNNELSIRYVTIVNPSYPFLDELDKRNDQRLLAALSSSRRLR